MKSITTMRVAARWMVYLLPAIVLLGMFFLGVDWETRRVLVQQWRAGELAQRPWTQLRLYYSKQEDELLYFEYANLLCGGGPPSQTRYAQHVLVHHPTAPGTIALPYRDFHLEYPPLALFAFLIPRLVAPTSDGYRCAFAVEMIIVLYLAIVMAYHTRRRYGDKVSHAQVCLEAALMSWLIGQLIIHRFDLVLAAILLAFAGALLQQRYRWAGFWAGIGGMLKIIPMALLPLPVVRSWQRSGSRRTVLVVGATLLPLLILLPFFVTAPAGLLAMVSHHTARGLQIESIYALILLIVHLCSGTYAQVSETGNSDVLTDISGISQTLAAMAFPLMCGAVIGLLWYCVRRGRHPHADTYWLYAVMLLLVTMILLSPIASPQFIIWLLPLVLAVPRQSGRLIRPTYGIWALCTQIQYDGTYHLLRKLHIGGVIGLGLRWMAFGLFCSSVVYAMRGTQSAEAGDGDLGRKR